MMLSRRRVVSVLVATAVTLGITGPASAAVWAPGTSGIVDVCFTSDDLTGVAATQATLAAQAWNVSSNLRVTYQTCDAGAVQVKQSFGTLSSSGDELGLTQWYESNGQFVSADITYDDTGVNAWGTALVRGGVSDGLAGAWRTVTCHEMGHALGLDHSTAAGSCMQTNLSVPITQPGSGDVAQLLALYGGTPTAVTSTTSTTSRPTSSTGRPTTTTSTSRPTTTTSTTTVDSTTTTSTTTVDSTTTSTSIPTATTVRPTTTSTVIATTTTVDATSTTVNPTTSTTVRPTTTTTSTLVTGSTTTTVKASHGQPKSCGTKQSDLKKWRTHLKHHKVKAAAHRSGRRH